MTDQEDAAMPKDQRQLTGPELKSGPMITSAALIAAGIVLAIAGLAVGGTHMAQAVGRWVRGMEVPPSERAKMTLAQAKAAAAAGADAWQKEPVNHRSR
jgi:hypothetical protein